MWRRALFVVAAVAALAVMATPAIAVKGGNSANAKKCQKGGWENYVRADQTPFTSAEDCSSYAARGGVVTEPQSDYAPRTLCEDMGYTYEEGEITSPVYGPGFTSYFRCDFGEHLSLTDASRYEQDPDVVAACSAYGEGARMSTGGFEGQEFKGSECSAYTGE